MRSAAATVRADPSTVAENIFLGAEPRRFGFVDFARLNREAAELLRTVGCETGPTVKMRHLSVTSRQLVEISEPTRGVDVAAKTQIYRLTEPRP